MSNKQLTLEIPEDILENVKLPSDEVDQVLRQELALALYARGIVTSGTARRLAQMMRWEFEELLGQRKVPRHYEEDDFDEDLSYARRHQ